MSRIDTPRPNAGAGAGPSSARLARALNRNDAPADQALVPLAPRPPREAIEGRPSIMRQEEALAIHAVDEADLAPLHAMGSERLVLELSRIDLALSDKLAQAGDPDLTQALSVGKEMLGETVRRLRLVQAGRDALVMKR